MTKKYLKQKVQKFLGIVILSIPENTGSVYDDSKE
jgi:hypothetical protein